MSKATEKISKSNKTNKCAPWSRIIGSPIEDYVNANSSLSYEQALEIFAKECKEALYVAPIDTEYFYKRFEIQRAFIVKILLYMGLTPNSETFTVIARLIDCIVSQPSLTLSECINKVAEVCGVSVNSVSKAIDKSFYIYDNSVYDKVTYLTRTNPVTAKDALYDIALYVGTKTMTIASEE